MRSDTKSIFIQADTSKVMRFLADPTNLPKWAVAFAQSVRRDGDRWVVATAGGEMGLRIVSDPNLGVVDYYMSPAPGVEALAGSRVVPNEKGAEYIFTQFQGPGMPDDMFNASVQALAHELTVLKSILERS